MKSFVRRCVSSRWLLAALLVLGISFSLPSAAWAQAASGSIEGYVYDPTGAVVPGATVQVVQAETGLTRTATTDDRGYYLFLQLPAGTYELTFTQTGFGQLTRPDVVVEVGDLRKIDVTMEPAAVRAQVVVTEAAPLLEASKTEVGTVVDRKLVSDLPLNGRNWPELVLLTPGVTNDGEFGNVTFAGVQGAYNNVQVDGADNNNAFFAEIRGRTRAVFQFSQETIREFRVANQNYSAEFGRAGGGIVNAITKTGTNEWHGAVWYYFRDDGMNAQDPISKSETTINAVGEIGAFIRQARERRQQYGFNVGGPIVKDRLFFFFNLDNQQRNEPRIMLLQDLGDEIDGLLGSQPDDPTDSADVTLAAREQGLGLLAISYFGPLVRPIPRTFDLENFFPRVDWRIDDNNTLTFTHNFQRWRSQNGIFTTVTSDDNVTAEALNSSDSYSNQLTLNSVIRPTLINEFRFQFTWDNTKDRANAFSTPNIRLRGVRFGGADFLHSSAGLFPGRFTKEQRLQYVDNLTWVKGRHTFKFGVDINRVVDKNFFGRNLAGSYSIRFRFPGFVFGGDTSVGGSTLSGGFFNSCIDFTTYDAAITGGSTPAQALSAALTPASCAPVLSNFQQRFFPFGPEVRQVNIDYGAYLQDSFRLHPRFTLYAGLRYEFQDMPEVCDTIGVALTGGNCVVNPLDPRTGFIPQDGNNFAPRIGFAWQPMDNWVVRGGYGLFYIKTPSLRINDALTNNNFFSFNQFISCSSSAAPACNFFSPANSLIFPNPLTQINPLDSSQTTFPILSAPLGAFNPADPFADIFVFDPQRSFGYVQHGSLEIERQVGSNTTVAASYLWSHGVHLDRVRNSNVAPVVSTCPTLSFTCARMDVFDDAGNVVQQSFITRIGATFSGARPNPNFRQILTAESNGSSIYHAFGLRIRHRFSQGLSFLTSWTISKNIDTGRDSLGFFSDVLDPFNPELDRALSRLDQRQRFVTSWVWEPQGLRDHESGAVRATLANWRISGILSAAQGRPLNTNTTGGSRETDFNEDNVIFDRVPFIGRNTFRGSGRVTLNLGVTKMIPVGERARAEIILQAFNIFNTPVFTFFNDDFFTSTRTSDPSLPGPSSARRVFELRPNPDFRQPTSSRRARDIQLGFRFTF
ncbi:MAG: TonB-dependent receptor domain-containing protein [Terriglobia bacterium]